MEGLIPFIIMLLIGSFFNSKKKNAEEEHKKAKPFTAQREQQNGPVKKLKEMSREMYQEIQKELEQENNQQRTAPPKQVMPKLEVTVAPLVEKKPESSRQNRVTRQQQKQVVETRKTAPRANLMPKSPDDIMKGVIFSEIIGPPKSKR